ILSDLGIGSYSMKSLSLLVKCAEAPESRSHIVSTRFLHLAHLPKYSLCSQRRMSKAPTVILYNDETSVTCDHTTLFLQAPSLDFLRAWSETVRQSACCALSEKEAYLSSSLPQSRDTVSSKDDAEGSGVGALEPLGETSVPNI